MPTQFPTTKNPNAENKMAKKSFIRKTAHTYEQRLLHGVEETAAGFATKVVTAYTEKNVTAIPAKLHKPIFWVAGMAAQVFLENDHLVAIAKGVTTVAGADGGVAYLPSTVKTKLGLGAVEGEPSQDPDDVFIPGYATERAAIEAMKGIANDEEPDFSNDLPNAAGATPSRTAIQSIQAPVVSGFPLSDFPPLTITGNHS